MIWSIAMHEWLPALAGVGLGVPISVRMGCTPLGTALFNVGLYALIRCFMG